jgi:hypothetical protein
LIFERCCETNPGQRPNSTEIVCMFRGESFLEALEVCIGAFKDYQTMVVPM